MTAPRPPEYVAPEMLVRDLVYTVRSMLEYGGCKREWAEILQRHLARIDGEDQ